MLTIYLRCWLLTLTAIWMREFGAPGWTNKPEIIKYASIYIHRSSENKRQDQSTKRTHKNESCRKTTNQNQHNIERIARRASKLKTNSLLAICHSISIVWSRLLFVVSKYLYTYMLQHCKPINSILNSNSFQSFLSGKKNGILFTCLCWCPQSLLFLCLSFVRCISDLKPQQLMPLHVSRLRWHTENVPQLDEFGSHSWCDITYFVFISTMDDDKQTLINISTKLLNPFALTFAIFLGRWFIPSTQVETGRNG